MITRFIVCDHTAYHAFCENVMWNYFYLCKRKKAFDNIWGQFFIDSGGFTCNGKYPLVKEYLNTIRIMNPDIFACQDFMCEPFFIKKTGLSLNTHIENTVLSYINICEEISKSDFDYGYCIPVIQGWTLEDYQFCIDLYHSYGINLNYSYVAIGSICKRTYSDTQKVIDFINSIIICNIHGFGCDRRIKNIYSSDTALSSWCKMGLTTKNGLYHKLYEESLC